MTERAALGLAKGWILAPLGAQAQTATNMAVPRGLAPLTVLARTAAGRAALGANFAVAGGIQTGSLRRSTRLP